VGLTPSNGALDPREASFNRNDWVYGEPDYTNASIFFNSELPLTGDITAYAFGGYNQLNGTSYNFIRRAGQDETVRSIFPNGFRPEQLSRLENASIAAGVRGGDLVGFKWDLSSEYGTSFDRLRVVNSDNASLGAASPTSVLRGGARFRQWTTNLDLAREFAMGDGSPLKLALGLEYRKEWYTLRVGEPASYINGGVPILDGPNAGKPAPAGIQSAIGVSPSDVIPGERDSKAIYAEVQKDLGDRLQVSGAVRHEDFSDFGGTTNYKLAGRFKLLEGLAVRGSVGTGFRAPALAQSFYSQSDNQFVNGQLLKVRILSVHDPITTLLGATPLKPEKSKDASLGVVFSRGPFAATLDVYRIKLANRIVISSNFQSPALTNLLAANGVSGIAAAAYLTNAVDTTTQGVDFTARYRQDMADWGNLTTTFAANFNRSTFDRIAAAPPQIAALGITVPLVDLTQQVRLTRSTPKDKETLVFNWKRDKWSVNLTNTRYGEVAQVALTGVTPARLAVLTPGYKINLSPSPSNPVNSDVTQIFRADIITDIDAAYDLTDRITVAAGVANVFDKYPEHQIASTVASVAAGTNGADNAGIFPYAYIAPYGVSGRFFYVKGSYRF
jgi:iron complex outermembrane receptor protein